MHHGLAQRLREGTRPFHTAAERAGVMPALLRGQLPRPQFVGLQRSLLALYLPLEAGLHRHARHPLLAPLMTTPLARGPALQADLATLHGPAWADDVPVAATARHYAARLAGLCATEPGALVAHAYVRYLGDLAGGQALARVVREAYALTGHDGTRFFHFGTPAQVAALGQALRVALNRLPVDEDTAQALVDEARWAFAAHVRLFEELATPAHGPAAGASPTPARG